MTVPVMLLHCHKLTRHEGGYDGKDNEKHIARVSTTINAPLANVWQALADADMIEQYMFGTRVVTDWKEGSAIVWQGGWQGKRYEDKGLGPVCDRSGKTTHTGGARKSPTPYTHCPEL